jgi:hypothetical protein
MRPSSLAIIDPSELPLELDSELDVLKLLSPAGQTYGVHRAGRVGEACERGMVCVQPAFEAAAVHQRRKMFDGFDDR